MPEFPLEFEEPIWLLLLLLIIPAYLIARRGGGAQSPVKSTIVFALRTIVILLVSTALANPTWVQRGEGLTVTVVLDRSYSIPTPLRDWAMQYLREASEPQYRDEHDRVASVTVGRDAMITALPDPFSMVNAGLAEPDRSATNLAAGLRLAMAIMPEDTANRIVLASDGNETIDSVLAAAEIARANNVPVDVLILEYDHENEVLFDRIVAPARARIGQSINLRMILRSQQEASGYISLRMNEEPVDLDPDSPGHRRYVTLDPGVNVIPVTIRMDDQGPAEFSAEFEPEDPAMDAIFENNAALSVTFVEGEGRVLVIEDDPAETENLVRALEQGDIQVERHRPDVLAGGLVALSGYDAVVLANIPRWMLDDEQDRMLHAYVHDVGGGLVMLGGPNSFGAGGWIDSHTARALPVRLDPPQQRQMPRGALALVMHSCEMPRGNYWSQEVARAAINALSRQDYIGIVEYDWNVRENFGATWAFPIQLAGDKQAALAATRQLVVGDTKDFGPLLQLAYDGLTSVNAGQKHVIIISDGDPQPPSDALLGQFQQHGITITTVMVIGHGSRMDEQRMRMMAEVTGGEFYHVLNPNDLPEIFIKEAQFVSRSLIQEGDLFQPQIVSYMPGSPIDRVEAVPPVEGYVLTVERDGLAQVPIVHATEEGNDPIYAYWNYGLGKSIAYTSDLMGRWGSRWPLWGDFQSFWSQSIRWVMRPSSPANMTVNTRMDGDTAVVEVEALDTDASFLNFLQTRAVVVAPDGQAERLALQQVGPGRYRGEFPVDIDGSYLVNVHYSTPSSAKGDAEQGNLQAAVTVPYPQEYRSITHNAPLLRQMAEMTGGRVLPAGVSPQDLDLFHRAELEVPRTPKHIWDMLAIIAAILFLLDVAARRLAVDVSQATKLVRGAVSRRGEVGTETVTAWKRTRQQVEHRRDPAFQKKQRERAGTRFDADEQGAGEAIDVGAEGPEQLRDAPASPERRDQPAKDQPAEDEGPHTSRLLKAKRRARGDDGGTSGGEGKS